MPTTIQLARNHDAAQIAELSRRTIENGLPWTWTPLRVGKAIADPNTNVAVARLAGAVIGFGIMEYSDEAAHLILFAVDVPDRRRGLGSQLLLWLEKVAVSAGITRINVEVRADNESAQAFYRKHSYVLGTHVPGMYYGAEDGICFSKRIGFDSPTA